MDEGACSDNAVAMRRHGEQKSLWSAGSTSAGAHPALLRHLMFACLFRCVHLLLPPCLVAHCPEAGRARFESIPPRSRPAEWWPAHGLKQIGSDRKQRGPRWKQEHSAPSCLRLKYGQESQRAANLPADECGHASVVWRSQLHGIDRCQRRPLHSSAQQLRPRESRRANDTRVTVRISDACPEAQHAIGGQQSAPSISIGVGAT